MGARSESATRSEVWRCALQDELQFSVYNFETADVEKAWKHFELYEAECKVAVSIGSNALLSDKKATADMLIERFPLLALTIFV